MALSQLGNVGGRPYWSWYGFESRVDWCACFVSWCANECGYPDKSAGWFWKEKKKIDSSVNWNSDSDTIGKKVTGLVFGDETDWTKRRKTYYETICKVLL